MEDIGVEMEGTGGERNAATPGRKARKEDFVYLEDREEEDAEEEQIAQREGVSRLSFEPPVTVLNGVPSNSKVAPVPVPHKSSVFKKAIPLSSFSTPQPAKKVTRVPRTSLAPRTRKVDWMTIFLNLN